MAAVLHRSLPARVGGEAIAEKLREQGVFYGASEVVVTDGAKQALFNAIAVVCGRGDELFIPKRVTENMF